MDQAKGMPPAEVPSHSDLSRHMLPLLTLALLALAAGLIATWHGVSYGYDGGYYLAYARAIDQTGLLRLNSTFWHNPATAAWLDAWPPLYPMILSLGGVVGIDPIPWARVVTVASLVASALLTYGIGWTILRSQAGAWAAAALFIAVPSTTSAVFGLAHSETVFTVMLLGIVWLLLGYRFGKAPASHRAALWAALIAAFTLLTRYIALGAIIGAGLYLLLWARTVRTPRRWWPAVFFVLSAAPLGLWALYLKATTGAFTGAQITTDAPSFEHVPESMRQIAVELLHGFGEPTRLLGLESNWWALAVAGAFAVLVVVLLWRRRVPLMRSFHSSHLLLALVTVVYIGVYWLLAAGSQWIVADWRHYVPVYPLILILVIQVVLWARIPRWLNAPAVALFLISGAQAVVKHSDGFYWNQPHWRDSSMLSRLPQLVRSDALVHANETAYLLLRLGLETTTRIFGGDAGYQEYRCSDLTYPEGFPYAVFVVIDTPFLRAAPPGEAAAFFRAWAEPCGTVESVVNDQMAEVTTVRLHGR